MPPFSPYLRDQRAWIAAELNQNPNTLRLLRGVLAHEQDPGQRVNVMESLANRLNYLRQNGEPNLTLTQYLSRQGPQQFYGPLRRGEINESYLRKIDQQAPSIDAEINQALSGSNNIKGMTDQGSRGDPNFGAGPTVMLNGEGYNDFGRGAAKDWRLAQQRIVQSQTPQLASVPPLAPTPWRNPDLTHVDSRLIAAVSAGASALPPGYKVTVNEGYNPNGHVAGSQHHIAGSGALDVQITDPQGHVIPNQGADSTGLYTKLAGASYTAAQQLGVGDKFAWGGRFGTVTGGSTPDLMHFDLGGDRGHFGPPLAQRFANEPAVQLAGTPPMGNTIAGPQPGTLAGNVTNQFFTPPVSGPVPLPPDKPIQESQVAPTPAPAPAPPVAPTGDVPASFSDRFNAIAPTVPAPAPAPVPPPISAPSPMNSSDMTFGHSPEAIQAAQAQGIWNPAQGQNLSGQPWNFPAMTSPPDLGGGVTGLPMIGLENPGAAFPSPMSIGTIPTNPDVQLPPPPPPIGNSGVQFAGGPALGGPQMPQTGGGMLGGLLGGSGLGGLNFGALANLGGGQAPAAPQMQPDYGLQIAASMQPPNTAGLANLLQKYRALHLIA